ncbi:MAG: thiol peroxidase [Bacteroidales bacterium]|nr:thiol peroxidase [Bacteroidales bacterium]MDE6802773.1 thiol peroxidase [Muribaculaceae bacterium]
MATIYFSGTECHTFGELPRVGSAAPEFRLVTPALEEVTKETYAGKRVVLNIFPSLDTAVCATSVRRFNKEAAALDNTVVLAVSVDLPFAAGRFCTAEGITNVTPASAFREPEFAKNYGVLIVDGPLKGLLARAVVIIDEKGNIAYADMNHEVTEEPHYDEALNVLKGKF